MSTVDMKRYPKKNVEVECNDSIELEIFVFPTMMCCFCTYFNEKLTRIVSPKEPQRRLTLNNHMAARHHNNLVIHTPF